MLLSQIDMGYSLGLSAGMVMVVSRIGYKRQSTAS